MRRSRISEEDRKRLEKIALELAKDHFSISKREIHKNVQPWGTIFSVRNYKLPQVVQSIKVYDHEIPNEPGHHVHERIVLLLGDTHMRTHQETTYELAKNLSTAPIIYGAVRADGHIIERPLHPTEVMVSVLNTRGYVHGWRAPGDPAILSIVKLVADEFVSGRTLIQPENLYRRGMIPRDSHRR